jgi:uncharacterized membrane protein
MSSLLSTYSEKLRASYWFIPAIMVTISIALSFIVIAIDEAFPIRLQDILGWIDISDPSGAYSFLSTVSGAMIGVTGVTFSITIVALVQASSQFGPRLLNNFLRDRGNQFVLGTFISTYTYCLFVLRSITNTPEVLFIPNLAMFVALVLAVMSIVVLVYFFHHVTVILQAEHVIAEVGRELEQAIERLFPESLDYSIYARELRNKEDIPPFLQEDASSTIDSEVGGYLQAIDVEALVGIAEEYDAVLRAANKPGDFVTKDGPLIEVWSGDSDLEEISQKVKDAFIIGDQRLRINDVEFSVDQLVEIAVRALSPGINDPFTAMACIDQLASGVSQLVQRSIPSGYHYGSEGTLRLITEPLTFSGILEASFNQIRQNAYSDVAVTIRLLEAISAIAPHIRTREQRDTLSRQAQMLHRASEEHIPEKWDREDATERFESTMETLEESEQ